MKNQHKAELLARAVFEYVSIVTLGLDEPDFAELQALNNDPNAGYGSECASIEFIDSNAVRAEILSRLLGVSEADFVDALIARGGPLSDHYKDLFSRVSSMAKPFLS